MKRSQKIFIGIMVAFFAGLGMLAYDISSKTSFPGAKKRQKLQIQHSKDSLDSALSPKSSIQQP